MSRKECISIIVPVFNVIDYLAKCIDSIIEQTYTDWELLLIDDGSTDGSGEICDLYSAKDLRIKTIHTSNRGVSAARNTGLGEAIGEWVCFVDSDDHVSQSYLHDLIENVHESDIVVSGWVQGVEVRKFPETVITRNSFMEVFMLNAFINICGKLFRREIINRDKIGFDEMVRWGEDSIFFIKVLLKCRKVAFISAANYYYNLRDNTAVGKLNSYENELAGFNAVNSLMQDILELFTMEVRKYFSPYLFLIRIIAVVKLMDISKKEKFKLLKGIDFDKKNLYIHVTNFKEKIMAHLILNKRWRIILILI